MRSKWYLPLAVLGLGGLTAMVFGLRDEKRLPGAMHQFSSGSDHLEQWSRAARPELDRIQAELHRLARSLEVEL